MAIEEFRIEVELAYISDMPGDVAVNTFHALIDTAADPADMQAGLDEFVNMYTGATTGPNGYTWGNILSPVIHRSGDKSSIKLYRLADTPPRVPVTSGTFDPDVNSNSTPLPLEVAIAISYGIDPQSGWDPRSLRGRIYLGPLNVDAQAIITTSVIGVNNELMSDLAWLTQALESNVRTASSGAVRWCLYSRRQSAMRPITHGFVDNEFDTQRRRGVDATARETWVALP